MPKDKTVMQERRNERATMDSFRVKRDGSGQIVPQQEETEFGTVLVIPMTYGDAEAMAEQSKQEDGLNAATVAKHIREHITEPDMSGLNATMIREEFKAPAVKELLDAINRASGLGDQMEVEVGEDGRTKVTEKNP